MWITQTYLQSPEPNAPLHIYYLFENYKESHVEATKRVQEELERLSATHPCVCILMPTESASDRIEGQLRENQKLWQRLQQNIPGLVISRKPIEKLNPNSDELFFIPLNRSGFSEHGLGAIPNRIPFAESIVKLRRLVSDDLSWQQRELGRYETPPVGLLERIFEAVEIKPGIAGFRIDLRKVFGI